MKRSLRSKETRHPPKHRLQEEFVDQEELNRVLYEHEPCSYFHSSPKRLCNPVIYDDEDDEIEENETENEENDENSHGQSDAASSSGVENCPNVHVTRSGTNNLRRRRPNYNELDLFKKVGIFSDELWDGASFVRGTSGLRSVTTRVKGATASRPTSRRIEERTLPPPPAASTASSNKRAPKESDEDYGHSDDDDDLRHKFSIAPIAHGAGFVDLDFVAGLDDCIAKLKEMVTYPLLFPEFYQRIGISPPKGVLFHGPPGTGKTLVARALAKFCSSQHQKVAFYVRNGGDCLSKYIGEGERTLRLLFADARRNQPAIIFFDEIDAIAPARTLKHDQSQASFVASLLAEMDGLSDRGQIVVIGATNRLQSLDVALRRPGRFDREFFFPLPGKEARRRIFDSHTRSWSLEAAVKDALADVTQGFSGADIKGLCLEAATKAFNRRFGFLFRNGGGGGETHDVDLSREELRVTIFDFIEAFNEATPCSRRSEGTSTVLSKFSKILLRSDVSDVVRRLSSILIKLPSKAQYADAQCAAAAATTTSFVTTLVDAYDFGGFCVWKPRLLICGSRGMMTEFVGTQAIAFLEGVFVQRIDLLRLHTDAASAASSVENEFVRLLTDAKAAMPAVLFVPNVDFWWAKLSEGMRDAFLSFVASLHPCDPLVLMATTECPLDCLPAEVAEIFALGDEGDEEAVYEVAPPPAATRRQYFGSLLAKIKHRLPKNAPVSDDIRNLNAILADALFFVCAKYTLDAENAAFSAIFRRTSANDFDDFTQFFAMLEAACDSQCADKRLYQKILADATDRLTLHGSKFFLRFVAGGRKAAAASRSTRRLRSRSPIPATTATADEALSEDVANLLDVLVALSENYTMEQMEKFRILVEKRCLVDGCEFSTDLMHEVAARI